MVVHDMLYYTTRYCVELNCKLRKFHDIVSNFIILDADIVHKNTVLSLDSHIAVYFYSTAGHDAVYRTVLDSELLLSSFILCLHCG